MGLKEEARRLGLDAQPSFWIVDNETLAMIIGKGGCGPGEYGDYLVPDTVFGLNIQPACGIHDYDYGVGKSKEDKEIADLRLLTNTLKIINTQSKSGMLRILRRYRAMSYYNAVVEGGGDAFENATIV